MRKILIALLILITLCGYAFAGQFTFTYDDGSAQRIIAGIERHYPVPLNEDGSPKYTHAQWMREVIRNFVLSLVQAHEEIVEKEKVVVSIDNNLLR